MCSSYIVHMGAVLLRSRATFLQCGPRDGTKKIRKPWSGTRKTVSKVQCEINLRCASMTRCAHLRWKTFNTKKVENETKVGHVKAKVCFSMWNRLRRLWKLIMQPGEELKIVLHSAWTPHTCGLAHPQGSQRERQFPSITNTCQPPSARGPHQAGVSLGRWGWGGCHCRRSSPSWGGFSLKQLA